MAQKPRSNRKYRKRKPSTRKYYTKKSRYRRKSRTRRRKKTDFISIALLAIAGLVFYCYTMHEPAVETKIIPKTNDIINIELGEEVIPAKVVKDDVTNG